MAINATPRKGGEIFFAFREAKAARLLCAFLFHFISKSLSHIVTKEEYRTLKSFRGHYVQHYGTNIDGIQEARMRLTVWELELSEKRRIFHPPLVGLH